MHNMIMVSGEYRFTLSQEILRSPGLYDVEPINLSIQEVSVLHNFLSFGFSIGVGLWYKY